MDSDSIKKTIESLNKAAHQLINFDKVSEFSGNLEDSLYKNVLAQHIESNFPQRTLMIKNSGGDIKKISITNMIMKANHQNEVNLYGSRFTFEDRKNLVVYLTLGFTLLKYIRTFKLRKLITYPIFAYPFFSLFFCREVFNPILYLNSNPKSSSTGQK